MNKKRILALIGVILLLLLYLLTFLLALMDFEGAEHLFAVCLLCTIAVPILIWIFTWIYKQTH